MAVGGSGTCGHSRGNMQERGFCTRRSANVPTESGAAYACPVRVVVRRARRGSCGGCSAALRFHHSPGASARDDSERRHAAVSTARKCARSLNSKIELGGKCRRWLFSHAPWIIRLPVECQSPGAPELSWPSCQAPAEPPRRHTKARAAGPAGFPISEAAAAPSPDSDIRSHTRRRQPGPWPCRADCR